jgi:23S rRNA (cytosine1962-C5)-methyltransferase
MEHADLVTPGWADYELIDSGDNRKLERYGKFILIRPETQALWRPAKPDAWKRADAEFKFGGEGSVKSGAKSEKGGSWRKRNTAMPDSWEMSWNSLTFIARLTSFKHTGIFPEQAANWEWIEERVSALRGQMKGSPRVLNLFGYTGIASLVAARHGAEVTHCDASKQSNTWAHENARLSGMDHDRIRDDDHLGSIRWITDDALAFALREIRRGAIYDGIILDPPAFGRGAKGEVFRIEEHLPKLLDVCAKLLAGKRPGAFFLLNGYAAGYAPQSFFQVLKDSFRDMKKPEGGYGELQIEEQGTKRIIPSGIYARFVV